MYTGFGFKFSRLPKYESIIDELSLQTNLDLDYNMEIIKSPHEIAYQLTGEILPDVGSLVKLKIYNITNKNYNYEIAIYPSDGDIQMHNFTPKNTLYFIGKTVMVLKSLGGIPEYQIDNLPHYLFHPYEEAKNMKNFRDIPTSA